MSTSISFPMNFQPTKDIPFPDMKITDDYSRSVDYIKRLKTHKKGLSALGHDMIALMYTIGDQKGIARWDVMQNIAKDNATDPILITLGGAYKVISQQRRQSEHLTNLLLLTIDRPLPIPFRIKEVLDDDSTAYSIVYTLPLPIAEQIKAILDAEPNGPKVTAIDTPECSQLRIEFNKIHIEGLNSPEWVKRLVYTSIYIDRDTEIQALVSRFKPR